MNSDVTIPIQFPSFVDYICSGAMIDVQSVADIELKIADLATQVPIILSAITDTGTPQFASYAGFTGSNCGPFTVV